MAEEILLPTLEEMSALIRKTRFGVKSADYLDSMQLPDARVFRDNRNPHLVGLYGSVALSPESAISRVGRLGQRVVITHMAYELERDSSDGELYFKILLDNGCARGETPGQQRSAYALFSKYGLDSLDSIAFNGDAFREVPLELVRANKAFMEKVLHASERLTR